MKYILIFLLISSKMSFAQQFSYPALPKQAKNSQTIIPAKWKVIATTYGDLNQDQTEDFAMILEYNLPITENRAYGDNDTELIKEFQRPRILAIYFKDSKTNKYVFEMQNNNFILRENEGGEVKEPFKKLKIENNSLNLAFEGGGLWRWELNYEFKYQNKNWALINANNTSYSPTSGELIAKNYNFLERRIKHTYGNIFTRDIANKESEENLYFTQLRTLANFKKPWTWEISKNNFL